MTPTLLLAAAALAVTASLGHSILSERLFLGRLRAEPPAGPLGSGVGRRLVPLMFHLPSLCWAGMAASLLLLEPQAAGSRATLGIYAGIYAISGLGNFWATRKPHPGGIVLCSAAALILLSLLSAGVSP